MRGPRVHQPVRRSQGDDGSRSWDSDRRLADLEPTGRSPKCFTPTPFSVSTPSVPSWRSPASDRTRRRATVGWLQAHNRWLADFCDQAPGRRGGIFQITLHDLDASITEMRWAKDRGLFGGIVLRAPARRRRPQLHDRTMSRSGRLRRPRDRGEPPRRIGDSGDGATGVDRCCSCSSRRLLTSGVQRSGAQRRPRAASEPPPRIHRTGHRLGGRRAVEARLHGGALATSHGSRESAWGREVAETLSLKPMSIGRASVTSGRASSAPTRCDRASAGIDRIMWGSDYPHQEGTGLTPSRHSGGSSLRCPKARSVDAGR